MHSERNRTKCPLVGISAGQRGLSVGRSRSRNHRVCLIKYKHDVSYTQAVERPPNRGKMTASLPLPLERRDPATRATTKTRGGRLRSTRARRRRTPVDATGRRRGTRALRAESAPTGMSYPKANNTHNKQPPKNQLDAKESRKD